MVLNAENPLSAASALPSPSLCMVTSSDSPTAARMLGLIDAESELVSPPQSLEVYNLLRSHAAARFNIPTGQDLRDISATGYTLSFTLYGESYSLPTPALYHVNNAVAVIEAYRALVRQKKNVTKKALDTALSLDDCLESFRLYSLSPAWLLDAANTPHRLDALEKTLTALPHLFGEGFDLLVETGLEDLCQTAFGNRINSLQSIDTNAVKKAVKALPQDTPLIILGSKPFLGEIKRALDARFLFG